MNPAFGFWGVLAAPLAGAVLGAGLRSPRAVLAALSGGAALQALLIAGLARGVAAGTQAAVRWGWFYCDALSALNLALLAGVGGLSTVYAAGYFRAEIEAGSFSLRQSRRFALLWAGALSALALVLISDNLGVLWIAIEASTLMTAFLISVHRTAASLEAMWKYLLMGSVGVAFAFLGVLLAAAAARGVEGGQTLLWTRWHAEAARLDLPLLKLAFLFLVVGYGTKAGLAPLHNWLPDAHSQAPGPVSALFSGFMLNTALYGILRYAALLEAASGGSGWSLRLLQVFGVASVVTASAFILFQKDLKRLLAYSSVEHIGIVCWGLGLGGAGIAAALFHVLNHALAKTLAFFAASRIGQARGTQSIERLRGAARGQPVWGVALLGAMLALIGTAPLAPFLSEFLLVRAAVERGAWITLAVFLAGASVAFIGLLKSALTLACGEPEPGPAPGPVRIPDRLIAAGLLAALLALGLWMPGGFQALIGRAAALVEGH